MEQEGDRETEIERDMDTEKERDTKRESETDGQISACLYLLSAGIEYVHQSARL